MERRTFLGALTAASLGVLLEGSFTEFAGAQNTTQAGASLGGQSSFEYLSSRDFRKHGIRASLRKGAGCSVGARLSPHKPHVAIPRAEARRESHRDLRGPARLRA